MSLYDDSPARVERSGALVLLIGVLCLAAALAGWLGWSHIHLTHGAGAFDSLCSLGGSFDCDSVNTSDWGELRGVPISFYAFPLYAMMALLAWVGRSDSERGRRARGGLVLLSGGVVAFSAFLLGVMLFDVGSICLFCTALDLLHVVILGLALAPPGGRRPALPAGLDMVLAFLLAVLFMGTSFQFSIIYGESLDRQAAAAIMEGPGLAQAEVATERRAGRVVALPDRTVEVPTDRYDPAVGPNNARVTVVEFADFECAYCRRLAHNLAPLKERYSDRVRFVFKHFPMDQACNSTLKRQHHPQACLAARASICAHVQRGFWPYHDLLFNNQDHLERADLVHYAGRLGLDATLFEACLDSDDAVAQLREDLSHGASLDVSGTPRTYVNGRLFSGAVSAAMLEAAILYELGEAETTEDGRVRTTEEVVTAAPLPPGPVPMVAEQLGDHRFFIDAVEASIDGEGRAIALAGATPATASWLEAQQACGAAGKRMCTVEEWVGACQGVAPVDDDASGSVLDDYVEGRPYPYGAHYREGWCQDSGDREAQRHGPAGAFGACQSPEGVYDLAGNLQEWVGADEGKAVLLGGAWYYGDKAGCTTAYDNFGPGMANRSTGFRCCADADVAAPAFDGASLTVGADLADPGDRMPAFEGAGIGRDTRFGSAQLQGKVTLINFWASWCTPCRKEMPALAQLYERKKGQGFELLAISIDRDPQQALRFLGGKAPPFPVILDARSEIAGLFDITAMPTSVLVGPDGEILERHAGFSDAWMAELEQRIDAELAR